MRCSTVGEVVDAVRRGLLDRDSAVEFLGRCGFTEPGRILDDLAPADGPAFTGKVGQGSSADYCQRWPGVGHSFSAHKPAGARLSVRICDGCGFIDGEGLERQVAERLGRLTPTGEPVDPASLAIEDLTDEERAGFLAALDEDKPRQVADLPCPKCGSDKTIMHWHEDGHDLSLSRRRCGAYDRPGEHFHRECRHCLADWVTTDMLDAEEGE